MRWRKRSEVERKEWCGVNGVIWGKGGEMRRDNMR